MFSYISGEQYRDCFDGAAVYCSDGRFGHQVDEFLGHGLGMSQCDRLVLPGGAARLVTREVIGRANDACDDLRFLVTAHVLERVVLIAHQDCAFYSQVLNIPEARKESAQLAHLALAAERLRAMKPGLRVEAYFARPLDREVVFSVADLSLKRAPSAWLAR